MSEELTHKRCLPCEGGIPAFDETQAKQYLAKLDEGWDLNADHKEIFRSFHFKNYCLTMAFVNAIAWIAHQEKHHPDLQVGYNNCVVHYSTHAIGGLSENDFICAAKVDQTYAQSLR